MIAIGLCLRELMRDIQNFESIQLLSELLESPDEFVRHLRRYATSIGSTMVYGWRVMSLENNVQAKTLFEVR